MKIAEINKCSDGEATIKYENGYTFIGEVDENNNPRSGIVRTPKRKDYIFDDLSRSDMLQIFNQIENGKCDDYLVLNNNG